MKNLKEQTIATINNTEIVVINDDEKRVPIKPICKALGIDPWKQMEKLNSHPILNTVTALRVATGSDGKEYEMTTLPYEYVYGWLFTIDPRNVKSEASDTVLKYQKECFRVLHNYFTKQVDFYAEKQELIDVRITELNKLEEQFNRIKKEVSKAKKNLEYARSYSLEQWEERNN